MVTTKKKPTAVAKKVAKSASRKRAAPRRALADAEGPPLTVAQARAMVEAATKPAGPRRARSAGFAGPAPATPATLAIQRRKLAIQKREEIKQREHDYAATLELLKARGIKGLPTAQPGARTKRLRRRAPGAPAAATGPLRVLAEGDSWFDYPVPLFGGGLIPRLENRLGVPILSLAKAGDETRYMLGVEQRQLIASHLRDGSPDGGTWELMLFSGGGNDIVANPLALWLRDFDAALSPAKLVHGVRFGSALALIRAAYEDLIEMRDKLSPQTHLVFHAYDFALPDGRGICHMGPWLQPAFKLRGYPADMTVATMVVKEMLVQFAAILRSLEVPGSVTFVNAQGTLSPVAASWHNEMHPSKGGFNQIADVLHGRIKTLFPGRVLQ